ncbi:MAG: 16S rRNA (adenine(1518)-N(6)/adenine(1519)-N(6))-dimethyltransferase RsmA [Armatimonadota bacterium]
MTDEIKPTSPSSVRRFLQDNEFRPSKRLGQNFLADLGSVNRIASVSGLQPGETCLEIGPGLGALTSALALTAAKVVAVEVDGRLADAMRAQSAPTAHVEIIHADFLKWDMQGWLNSVDGKVRVVANIPYSITSPIIEILLGHKDRLSGITLLVQKEVAERITASPGSDGYSSLTVFCAYHADSRIVCKIARHLFIPVPDVDSSVLTLTPKPSPLAPHDEERFFKILRAAFQQRRKTVGNSLSDALTLPKSRVIEDLRTVGIDPSVRAEVLSLDDFVALARALDMTSS